MEKGAILVFFAVTQRTLDSLGQRHHSRIAVRTDILHNCCRGQHPAARNHAKAATWSRTWVMSLVRLTTGNSADLLAVRGQRMVHLEGKDLAYWAAGL